MTQPQAQPPLLARRVGPLPVWIWFLILVLAVAGVIWWRRRQAASEGGDGYSSVAMDQPGGVLSSDLPTILPYFPQELQVTINREEGSQDDTPTPTPPPPTKPPVTPPPPIGTIPPTTSKPPAAKPPAASSAGGKYITVAKFTSTNTPWNSTLWGIWNHLKNRSPTFRTTAANWQEIWSHPNNKALRAKRGKPELIRERDKVWVPGKSI